MVNARGHEAAQLEKINTQHKQTKIKRKRNTHDKHTPTPPQGYGTREKGDERKGENGGEREGAQRKRK